jgi:GTP-binding protein
MLEYVPIAFITAKSGKNVYRLLNLAQQLFKQSLRRVRTGELNRVIRDAIDANVPPVRANRVPKIYYATQVATQPPTIVLVSNAPELFDDTYLRYLRKTLRESFPFSEVPIRLMLKTKGEAAARGDAERVAAALEIDPIPENLTPDGTQVIPVLAEEPPIDELDPQFVDEDDQTFDPDAPLERPAAPAAKKTQASTTSSPSASTSRDRTDRKKKKKPKPGTWDV